jgi:hypothetical protein
MPRGCTRTTARARSIGAANAVLRGDAATGGATATL